MKQHKMKHQVVSAITLLSLGSKNPTKTMSWGVPRMIPPCFGASGEYQTLLCLVV